MPSAEAPGGFPTKFTMTITIDMMTGQTNVNAPLAFKHVCYAMLGQARYIVDTFKPTQTNLIVPAPGSVPPLPGPGEGPGKVDLKLQ